MLHTSMTCALKILEGQQFWAAARDCTNDPGELFSTNAIILDIAQVQRRTATGLAARVLDHFLRHYRAARD
jgi:hypothetical protein